MNENNVIMEKITIEKMVNVPQLVLMLIDAETEKLIQEKTVQLVQQI
jgi:hypothetical protein